LRVQGAGVIDGLGQSRAKTQGDSVFGLINRARGRKRSVATGIAARRILTVGVVGRRVWALAMDDALACVAPPYGAMICAV